MTTETSTFTMRTKFATIGLYYLDACVLSYAAEKANPNGEIAREFLESIDGAICTSELTRAETLPHTESFHGKESSPAKYLREFFEAALVWVRPDRTIFDRADAWIVNIRGLKAMDAAHVSSAVDAGALFVTAEREASPIFLIPDVEIGCLQTGNVLKNGLVVRSLL